MRQRMSHLIAGQTVDESISHLIIDKAVSKHTGTTVTMALDTLCGPCGVISYEMARRLGYDVDSLLPQSLRAPTQTDLTGNARPLLPVEPAPKPIHSVDGSPLQIFGRINGLKLCVNNQHDLEFDVLVGGAAVGCDRRSLLLPRAPPYYGSSTTTRGNKDPYYPWWAVLCNT